MNTRTLILTAALAGSSAIAQADLVSTFGFTDLNGSYNGQTFEALSAGGLPTGGDVTDYTNGPPTSADFASGSLSLHNFADVVFRMDISNITATTADGDNGRLVIRDEDGDVLSGSFHGSWDFRFGFGFFDGEITVASYNDAGDGLFTGTDGSGAWSTPDDEYTGAISFLIEMPEWFSDVTGAPVNFDERSTQGDGILITPSPGGIAVLGLGGLVASRRRRS